MKIHSRAPARLQQVQLHSRNGMAPNRSEDISQSFPVRKNQFRTSQNKAEATRKVNGAGIAAQDDADLLAAVAQTRDTAAFAELSQRYESRAYNLAYNMIGNRAWAEESVQESLLQVWKSASSYRGDGPVAAWIMRIVARNSIKTQKVSRRTSARISSCVSDEQEATQLTPESNAETSELQNALRDEYQRLPEIERQLIGLHFGGGLSQQEIGNVLSMPQQTISYRLNEALKSLRTRLSAAGFASAAPLLTLRGMNVILTSGQQSPAGLSARITKLANARNTSRITQRARTAFPKSSLSMVIGGSVIVACAAAFALWAPESGMPAQAKSQPIVAPALAAPLPVQVTSPVPKTPAAVAEPPDFMHEDMHRAPDWHKRWSFQNGVPKDLVLVQGKWNWNREQQTLDIPDEAKFFPIYLLSDEPMLVTIKGRIIDTAKDTSSSFQFIKDAKQLAEIRTWNKHEHLRSRETTQRCYIYGNRIVSKMEDEPGLATEYVETTADSAFIIRLLNT